jgi:hypothetical protein
MVCLRFFQSAKPQAILVYFSDLWSTTITPTSQVVHRAKRFFWENDDNEANAEERHEEGDESEAKVQPTTPSPQATTEFQTVVVPAGVKEIRIILQ